MEFYLKKSILKSVNIKMLEVIITVITVPSLDKDKTNVYKKYINVKILESA